MYITIDVYHDRKENKNVGTIGFIQFYIISQHCLRYFKRHDLSMNFILSINTHVVLYLMCPSLGRGYHR
jgi:hypothetical protein